MHGVPQCPLVYLEFTQEFGTFGIFREERIPLGFDSMKVVLNSDTLPARTTFFGKILSQGIAIRETRKYSPGVWYF